MSTFEWLLGFLGKILPRQNFALASYQYLILLGSHPLPGASISCLLFLRQDWLSSVSKRFWNILSDIINAIIQTKRNNWKGSGSGLGADVCVTGSSEYTLMMTFQVIAIFFVAIHGSEGFATLDYKSSFIQRIVMVQSKQHESIKVIYLLNQPAQFNQPDSSNLKMFTYQWNLI